MHRDIKPENFLIAPKSVGAVSDSSNLASDSLILKLADFGLAKEMKRSSAGSHTEYVSTRWYRAPELVLRSQNYKESVDIFALGCIMAEMYLGRPLFPGTSEADQLTRIVTVMGTPSNTDWPEGQQLASSKGISFPTSKNSFRE